MLILYAQYVRLYSINKVVSAEQLIVVHTYVRTYVCLPTSDACDVRIMHSRPRWASDVFASCVLCVLQVLRGGHPNWLVEDQEEMEARRWNAVEDRLQDLDRELNEIGEDARRQRNHPQRVEYERQIQLTTNRINEEVARFESLSKRLHSSSINEQWLQEMELIHRLGVKSPRFDVAVECARERLEKWKEQRQGESPTEHDVPEHNFNKPLFSSGGELDQVDLRLIRISETPAPLELSSAEREELQGQLKEVQAKTSESQRKHEEYLEMALKCLRVTDDETDEELPLTEFHPEEQV